MKNIKTPKDLLDFMSSINYGYLGKSGRIYHFGDNDMNDNFFEEYILETPDELLNNKYGNCWDQAELEREWFSNNNYEFKTLFEIVNLDYKNDYPTHSFLIYKEDNKWNWFENSDYDNRGIHSFNTIDELLDYQYDRYLDLLKKYNISDEEITKIDIFEFDKPKAHITPKEYLEFVTSSNKIRG